MDKEQRLAERAQELREQEEEAIGDGSKLIRRELNKGKRRWTRTRRGPKALRGS